MATMNSTGMAYPTPTSDVAVPPSDRSRFAGIIGNSQGLLEVFDLIEHVAASDANILNRGRERYR